MNCMPQSKGSLGERLAHSFATSFTAGMKRVIIVGSDCPFLTLEILAYGFDLLQNNDRVIGPAHDGGYYLIGLSKPDQLLWAGIDWGTDKVLQQTIEIARNRGLKLALLPSLADIDRPEDLQNLNDPRIGFNYYTSRE
jgi:rSAM/selenodomain-associated transferase 1